MPRPSFYRIPFHSNEFNSFEEELAYIDNKLDGFSDYSDYDYFLSIVAPLGFCADKNDQETMALEEKYAKTRTLISKIYSENNFVEAILNQLFDNSKCD